MLIAALYTFRQYTALASVSIFFSSWVHHIHQNAVKCREYGVLRTHLPFQACCCNALLSCISLCYSGSLQVSTFSVACSCVYLILHNVLSLISWALQGCKIHLPRLATWGRCASHALEAWQICKHYHMGFLTSCIRRIYVPCWSVPKWLRSHWIVIEFYDNSSNTKHEKVV